MGAFWLLNWVHGGSIHCKKRHWKRKTRFLREDHEVYFGHVMLEVSLRHLRENNIL